MLRSLPSQLKDKIMRAFRILALLATASLVSGFLAAAEAEKFAAKCIVAGKPDAKQDKFAEYKGGKVYFCCDNCKAKYTSEPSNFETAANHQLVVTAQYKQAKCPLSGGPVDATKTVEVGGVKVAFCCEKCQGKVAEADAAAQKELVFSTKAFDKAFQIVK